MSWERFQYICRRVAASSSDDIAGTIDTFRQHPSGRLYGAAVAYDSIAGSLLRKIAALNDVAAARQCAAIYGAMRFQYQEELPRQLRYGLAYLVFLGVALFFAAVIYDIKVLPVFISMYENWGVPPTRAMTLYRDYAWLLYILIALLLLLAFLMTINLRALMADVLLADRTLMFRYLLSDAVVSSAGNLRDVLHYPLAYLQRDQNSPLDEQLASVAASGLVLAEEISRLADIQRQKLVCACDRQMQILMITMSVLASLAVIYFVISAYLPIFHLGDAV